jgi:DnaK suppressor protein
MESSDLRRYKNLLQAKRDELLVEFDTRTVAPPAAASEGDLLDQARADVEADLQISLRQSDNEILKEIEGALVRINHGTFGECEVCKKPLSKARLEAMPWTRVCRECKEQSA